MAHSTCADVRWDAPNGVVRCDFVPGAVVDLDEARAIDAEILELDRGGSPMCVDIRTAPTIDRTARQHFMAMTHVSAVAMLVGSATTRMLGNFFQGLNRSRIPGRVFTDEADALAWLGEHR